MSYTLKNLSSFSSHNSLLLQIRNWGMGWEKAFVPTLVDLSRTSERSPGVTICVRIRKMRPEQLNDTHSLSDICGHCWLIFKSPSYSSALSIILALTTVLWFVMGLNTLSCQIFVLGPIGDVGICSHQLHHLCCVGDLLGQWTCVQSSEYQHHCTIRGKQVGEKNNNNS